MYLYYKYSFLCCYECINGNCCIYKNIYNILIVRIHYM